MKKALSIIFNVFWILSVGISSVIVNATTGIACCITLIGIPFGLQHFKFIPLAFAPAGKVVVSRPNKHPVLNFLWMIFGGFVTSLYYYLLGLFFMLTIVGYPIAVQLFKIASFCSAPFGAEIVVEGKYSSTKDTPYDNNVVATRILENPDKTIDTPTGVSTSTRNYLLSFRDAEFIAAEKKFKTSRVIGIISAALLLAVWVAYIIMIFNGTTNAIYLKLFPDTSSYNPLATVLSIVLGYGFSKFIPVMLSFLGFMVGMSLLVLNPVATAKKNLYGKILSPNNIKWLISCYPDNTDVKSFFYSSPEKMLKKLNVALSKGASPTPIIIEELSFYNTNEDDDLDTVLQNADECVPEADETVDEITAPEAEETVAEEITTDVTEATETAEFSEPNETSATEQQEIPDEAEETATPIEETAEVAENAEIADEADINKDTAIAEV